MAKAAEAGTDTGIVFVDAPPARKGGGRTSNWGPLLDVLVSNPGRWGVMRTFDKASQAGSAAGHLRNDAHKPDGVFLFTSALEGEDANLYGIYLGPEGTPVPEEYQKYLPRPRKAKKS